MGWYYQKVNIIVWVYNNICHKPQKLSTRLHPKSSDSSKCIMYTSESIRVFTK